MIDDRVKRLAGELGGKGGPAGDLGTVMGWVHDNMAYDHSVTSLVASTDHALDEEARRLLRLPRTLFVHRPRPRFADTRYLRVAPLSEEPALPLQARGLSPPVRLGQFRRVGNAAAREDNRSPRPTSTAAEKKRLVAAAVARLHKGSATTPGCL